MGHFLCFNSSLLTFAEQTFFKDKRNWTETPRPCPEKFPISTSSALSASPVSSSPRKNSKSSVDAPSHHESVCPNTKEDQLHSRKQIRRPSGLPVLPTIRQKPSKPFQGQKSTKEYICSLADCHYKNKDTDSSPADQTLGSVSTDEGPTAQKDLGLQNLKAKPGPSVIHVPYRPKGGYIVDPELQPKRGRAGPFTNRGALLFGRKSNVLEGLNVWNNPELLLVSQSVPWGASILPWLRCLYQEGLMWLHCSNLHGLTLCIKYDAFSDAGVYILLYWTAFLCHIILFFPPRLQPLSFYASHPSAFSELFPCV